ncbi:MAG: PAS domain S-box protein [candidate division Zixibacteria bacterium]|nr:PAS domain S-box protein [candidate division Zixibacteria bacterium]
MNFKPMKQNTGSNNTKLQEMDTLRRRVAELKESYAELSKSFDSLKHSESRFRQIAELLPGVVYESDLDFNFIFFNNSGFNILGYTQADLDNGLNARSLIGPEDWEILKASSNRVLAGELIEGNVYTVVKKDGQRFKAIIHSVPIMHNSRPVGFRGIAVDVTRLNQAEMELRESEEKYRNLVNLLPEVIFEIDLNGKITFFNEVGFEKTAYSQEDIDSGLNAFKLFVPEDHARLGANMKRLMEGEKLSGNEYAVISKDGRKFQVLIHSSLIVMDKKPVGIRGIAYEITEFKKAQSDLFDSEERYRLLLEQSIDAIYMMVDEKFEFVNKRFVEMFGWTEEEILSPDFDWRFIVAPSSRQLIEKRLEILNRGEIPPNRYEYTALTKTGREIELEVSLSYISYKGKTVIQGVYHDITQKKIALKALQESEERYRAVWESSPVGICLTDQDGVYYYINPAYCEIYGYRENELIGRKFFDVISPPERSDNKGNLYKASFEKGIQTPVGETQFMRKDGQRIWVQYSSDFVCLDGKPKYKVSMNLDITERKAAEAELHQAKERFMAQFQRLPLPSYSWQKVGDDFILTDYNEAALEITNGKIPDFIGAKATVLYKNDPGFIEDLRRCFKDKKVINKDVFYHFQSTGEKRYLSIRYVYIPPVHVIVHTEDITATKLNEIRNRARLQLLTELRSSTGIDECLQLGCRAIVNSELFERAVLTLHNDDREIMNLGQVGLDERIVAAVQKAPAPDSELTKSMTSKKFRISNSYFIPSESGLLVSKTPRHIRQPIDNKKSDGSWQAGDELFVPIIGDTDRLEGWLSVDTPHDNKRPTKDSIVMLEEIVDIVIKKLYSLQRLEELNKERKALEDANIALREVLATIEQERINFKNQIGENVNQVLLPAFRRLIGADGKINQAYLNLLEAGLKELAAHDSKSHSLIPRLTARELEICNLIKTGSSSKDIAEALNVSLGTIQKHREKIRKKLELTSKKINLANYLKTL